MFNFNKIWLAIFVVIISLPLVVQISGLNLDVESFENRAMAEYPKYPKNIKELNKWTDRFEAYINDNLPFRIFMMKNYNTFLYYLEASANKKIILGENGWVFSNFDNVLNQYIGRSFLSKAKTKNFCDVIKRNADYFESRKIPFYFFIAPNKHTIYNEHLPSYTNKIIKQKRNFDIVRSYLKENTQVREVNIRPDLLEYKQKLPKLYYKTDTHWNGFGSFVAYLRVINAIKMHFKSLKKLSWIDTYTKEEVKNKTDLSNIMGLWNNLEGVEINNRLKKNNRIKLERIGAKQKFPAKETHIIETKNKSGLVLLLLRDSFSTAMIPYYEHSFSKIIATHHNYGDWDTSLLLREKPDLVIFEVVERYLGKQFKQTKFPKGK